MKCQHGAPFHVECVSCELTKSQRLVASLRRELGDEEVRLALLAIRKNNEPRRILARG